jgi:hypothetical protein
LLAHCVRFSLLLLTYCVSQSEFGFWVLRPGTETNVHKCISQGLHAMTLWQWPKVYKVIMLF